MLMYEMFARLYPRNFQKEYVKLLRYLKMEKSPTSFMGFVVFFGLGLSLGISFFLATWTDIPLLVYFIGLFIII